MASRLGWFEGAKKLWEGCVPGMVKFLGANHDVTLSTLDRLGEVYYRLEQYQKASDC